LRQRCRPTAISSCGGESDTFPATVGRLFAYLRNQERDVLARFCKVADVFSET